MSTYEKLDELRGKLLAISEITNNKFMSKKAKEKEEEVANMIFDL